MQQFEWVHAAWLALAIALEILANVFLKFSDGFRRKFYGIRHQTAPPSLTTVAEDTQQHQEQVDEVQIKRQRAQNRVFAQV